MSEITIQDLVNVDGTDKKEATKLGIRLMTSKDRMRLYIVMVKEIPDLGVLRNFVTEAGVKAHFSFDKLSDPETIEKINKGRYPVLISDLSDTLDLVPSVHFLFEAETLEYLWNKLVSLEAGQNPPKLKKILVKSGTVLADIPNFEDMKKELSYKDVFGRSNSGEGRISKIEFGEGVEINEETRQAIAAVDGFLDFKDFTISVIDKIVVDNPETVESKSVDFVGSIEINTPFAPEGEDELENAAFGQFIVKAGESIVISGDWGHKSLWAGKDILIAHEINGDLDTTLKAGGRISAIFANRINAVCNDDFIVEHGLYYSNVKSFGKLKVLEGPIVGGEYYGAAGIESIELGNSDKEETVVMAGCVDNIEGGLKSLKRELLIIQKKLADAQKVVKPYLENVEKNSEMTDEEKEGVTELLKNMKLMKTRYVQLQEMIETRNSTEIQQAEIKISGPVYPGAVIIINNAKYSVAEKLDNVIFSFDKETNAIKINEL